MRMYAIDVVISVGLGAAAVHSWLAGSSLVSSLLFSASLVAQLYIAWAPAVWVRRLHMGASESMGTSMLHARKVGRNVPTPYPDAWYNAAFSAACPPGAVLPVTICNVNLVVWRPEAKKGQPWPHAVVMDAYCTHLGAHLAFGGGSVLGDCIRCPFHGWQFDTTGRVAHVPESDTCPGSANMRMYPCVERNGNISVWMSAASHKRPPVKAVAAAEPAAGGCTAEADKKAVGAGRAPGPWYDLPTFEQLNGSGQWNFQGYTEHIVNAHLLEIPENGSDVAHLPALHGQFIIPQLAFAFGHEWAATWTPGTDGRKHIADITIDEAITLYGVPLPGKVSVSITQVGISQVFLQLNTPLGRMFVVETVTPIAPLKQRVLHALYTPSTVPAVAAKMLLTATIIQFEKDVPIWCNKKYEARPVLSKVDRVIPSYRRWVTQFWREDAVTFEEATRACVADALGLPADARLDW